MGGAENAQRAGDLQPERIADIKMALRIFILFSVLLFSCSNGHAEKPASAAPCITGNAGRPECVLPTDTTSSDYFIYLLKNERKLNSPWVQKLKNMGDFPFSFDSISDFSLVRDWAINDSVSVIIFSNSDGTVCTNDFLITIKKKAKIISAIQINKDCDSDLVPEQPYYYTRYKLINDRKIKLFNHKVTGIEGGKETDKTISEVLFSISDNGEAKPELNDDKK